MLDLCFVIRSLAVGGAERQLVEMVRHFSPDAARVTVLVFYPGGALEGDLAHLPHVRVVPLDKRGRWDVGFLWRGWRAVRAARPQVIVGCLAGAIEAALLLGWLTRTPVVWRLGAAYMDFSLYDWAPRALFALERRLSRFPAAIAVNAHAGLAHHRDAGWDARRMVVIPQGFDLDRYAPDRSRGQSLRRQWSVPDAAVLIGLPARLDPIKDHATFLEAAARARTHLDLRFVCVGDGDAALRGQLEAHAKRLGLGGALTWAGHHTDMAAVYNALDIVCLTSIGEGLPNALGEAMACGVPAVATDVGDVRQLVGESGLVVPAADPEALASALVALGSVSPAERDARGVRARAHIAHAFAIAETSRAYLALLQSAARTQA